MCWIEPEHAHVCRTCREQFTCLGNTGHDSDGNDVCVIFNGDCPDCEAV